MVGQSVSRSVGLSVGGESDGGGHITVLNQMICTSRQVNFQICRSNCFKIGKNTTANKFYALNNQIGLGMLNLSFVHF